jgi:hypothetical protein
MLAEREIHNIRSRFPIFSRKISLNSCSQGALSDAVEACIQEYLRTWHDAGSPWDVWVQKYEAVRAEFEARKSRATRRTLRASAGQIATSTALTRCV